MTLGAFDRADDLARLADGTFDVLVIGGGITGAGVALDAAVAGPAHRAGRARRLRLRHVVEVARSWSTAGCATCRTATSASCTRRCASASACCRNAPHLVKVLPFLIPMFTGKDGLITRSGRPGARARPCGCTTSPAAPASASSTSASTTDEAVAHMPTLPERPAGRRPTSTTTPRPTTPASRSPIARTAALDHGAVVANHAARASASARTRTAGSPGPSSRPTAARIEVAGPRGRQRHRRVGRRRPGARRGRPPRHASARPRASTSPCPWEQGAQRHRRRRARAEGQAQRVRGAVAAPTTAASSSPTSAPPTPTTTGRSTTRSARADDVDYLLEAINRSVTEPLDRGRHRRHLGRPAPAGEATPPAAAPPTCPAATG